METEGLSEYNPSSVSFEDEKVIIKRPKGHGDPLIVKFPQGSTNQVARYGIASFEYDLVRYEVHQ